MKLDLTIVVGLKRSKIKLTITVFNLLDWVTHSRDTISNSIPLNSQTNQMQLFQWSSAEPQMVLNWILKLHCNTELNQMISLRFIHHMATKRKLSLTELSLISFQIHPRCIPPMISSQKGQRSKLKWSRTCKKEYLIQHGTKSFSSSLDLLLFLKILKEKSKTQKSRDKISILQPKRVKEKMLNLTPM